jgi:hypothetical protein
MLMMGLSRGPCWNSIGRLQLDRMFRSLVCASTDSTDQSDRVTTLLCAVSSLLWSAIE